MINISNNRYLSKLIQELSFDNSKMAFISGPRQVGKTTFTRSILKERNRGHYYSWDEAKFRKIWARDPQQILDPIFFNRDEKIPVIILDEIHKHKLWKRSLKGLYDTLEERIDIIVTGSARLNIYKKGSDSLLGRYLSFRLHPFTLGEVLNNNDYLKTPDEFLSQIKKGEFILNDQKSKDIFLDLFKFSGFPDPFTKKSDRFHKIWQRSRLEKIVHEDLRDLSNLPDLSNIDLLVSLMPERVAQPLSRNSLREDLGVAVTTVSRWLNYLEMLYYHYELKPYANRISNGIKKEGKLYLWDYSEVEDVGARFENLVANHLLKACHLWTDAGYGTFELKYLKNKQKKEIDFLILKDKKPWLPIEVKSGDVAPSTNWKTFFPQIDCTIGLQLVRSDGYLKKHKIEGKELFVVDAISVLRELV